MPDELAIIRARVASHFYLLRCVQEGAIRQDYAFKIAAAMNSLHHDEAAATAERLGEERDAALRAVAAKIAAEEKELSDREIANVRRRRCHRRRTNVAKPSMDFRKAVRLLKRAEQIETRPVLQPRSRRVDLRI